MLFFYLATEYILRVWVGDTWGPNVPPRAHLEASLHNAAAAPNMPHGAKVIR